MKINWTFPLCLKRDVFNKSVFPHGSATLSVNRGMMKILHIAEISMEIIVLLMPQIEQKTTKCIPGQNRLCDYRYRVHEIKGKWVGYLGRVEESRK